MINFDNSLINNSSNNNYSINNKFIYPKYLVKYGGENIVNKNISKKKIKLYIGPEVGIGAYSLFTKLNKTSYPTKN